MLRTKLCVSLDIEYPIFQAGMGVYKGLITTPELVAAVSNAGGMGCLGATGLEPEELRDAIRRTRMLTDRPFGVDLIIPTQVSTETGTRSEIRQDIAMRFPDHLALVRSLFERYGIEPREIEMAYSLTREFTDAQVRVVFEERVPVLVVALGDPVALIPEARKAGTRVAGMAGSLRNVRRHLAGGVDFIICQGSEAGGHVGTLASFPLIPQAVDAAGEVPVVAAGGIADGRGVAAALALGAQAVWCGSAFLFAEEANVHPQHRQQLVSGRSEDFVTSRSFTGKTSRTYRNEVQKIWADSGLSPLPMPHQQVLMEDFLESARAASRLDLVNNPAGQITGHLHAVKPAERIFREMLEGAESTLQRLNEFP